MTADKRPARPEIVGHGGAAGFFAGNTAASISKALQLQVDRIEVDVQSTADGKLVLFHDSKVTIGQSTVALSHLTAADIRVLYPDVISLDDAYELCAGKCPMMLDLKNRGSASLVINAIRSMSPNDDVSASSTHARLLRKLRFEFPKMSLGLSRGHSLTKVHFLNGQRIAGNVVALAQVSPMLALTEWCGADNVMLNHHICHESLLRPLRRRGLRINAWTVDRPDDIHRMIQIEVDAIISNRPDLVQQQLA